MAYIKIRELQNSVFFNLMFAVICILQMCFPQMVKPVTHGSQSVSLPICLLNHHLIGCLVKPSDVETLGTALLTLILKCLVNFKAHGLCLVIFFIVRTIAVFVRQ